MLTHPTATGKNCSRTGRVAQFRALSCLPKTLLLVIHTRPGSCRTVRVFDGRSDSVLAIGRIRVGEESVYRPGTEALTSLAAKPSREVPRSRWCRRA